MANSKSYIDFPVARFGRYNPTCGDGPARILEIQNPNPSSRNEYDFDGDGITDCIYYEQCYNIADTDVSGLEIMDKIKWRKFDWNPEKSKELGYGARKGHVDMWVIAQEVEEFMPSVVSEDPETGCKELGDSWMLKYACKAIQELSAKVDALTNNNNEGENSEVKEQTGSPGEATPDASSNESSNGDSASGTSEESEGSVSGISDENGDAPGSSSDGGASGPGSESAYPEGSPSAEWTKDQLKAYMDASGITYNSGDTKDDLIAKIEGV